MANESRLIREATEADWPAIWRIIEPVFREGKTYAFATDITEDEAREIWCRKVSYTFVAEHSGQVAGSYFIKPNQPGPGSHVCNCGYIVDSKVQGQGIASRMCEHSQQVALENGFRAMQYNFVVSTNTRAIGLWKKHGFQTVGKLPGAFRHPSEGYVDALVMFKQLRN